MLAAALLAWPVTPAAAQDPGQPPLAACKPGGGFTVIGYPDEFGPQADSRFDVHIDDRFQGQFITSRRIWLPAITSAIQKWNGVPGSQWQFNDRGLTGDDADLFDGQVTIAACGGLFGCPDGSPPVFPGGPGGGVVDFFPQTTLAVTLVTESGGLDRRILNSDIFFNPEIPFEVDPNSGQIDFETVLVHELGHALGVGHNDNCGVGETVMSSSVDLAVRNRELSNSETQAVRFLYPDDSTPALRISDLDRTVRFRNRADGFAPLPQSVNVYGRVGRNWSAAASQPWVTLDNGPGRLNSSSAVEVQVNPAGLEDGTHRATVTLTDLDHSGPGTTFDVVLEINTAASEDELPRISSAGILNGANLSSGNFAPGSLITFFGSNLSTVTAQADSFPLPRRIEDVEVIINGREAPLLFVSPGQINAIVPNETLPGRGGVIMRTGLGQDRGTPFTVSPAAPEPFLMGENHVIALNQDGTLNGPDNKAKTGEVVVIFFTGIGWTHPFVETGTPAPSDPLAVPQLESHVWVAGVDADLPFIGFSPGFSGLAQANVVIPEGFNGDLPVQIQIGDARSALAFISVE